MGERRAVCRVLLGKVRVRDHLEDPGIGRRIILRWIFRKWGVKVWTGPSLLGLETGGGHFLIR